MPDDRIREAAYWQTRAKEARAAAQCMRDPAAKRNMLETAEAYEKLGALAEKRPVQPDSRKRAGTA